MVTASITASVGIRYGKYQQKNLLRDQDTVARLLANIPIAKGGYKEHIQKGTRLFPLLTPGKCSRDLYEAILYFQDTMAMDGLMANSDGAVDPGFKTLRRMTELAPSLEVPGLAPPEPAPNIRPNPIPDRAGEWRIVGVSSFSLGEVGLLGGFSVDISQPDNKKFRMGSLGGGFGFSIPLDKIAKVAKNADSPMFQQVLKKIGENIGLSVSDFLVLLGLKDASQDIWTAGAIFPGPHIRPPMMRHELVSRGGSSVPAPILVLSAGGALVASIEAGLILFGVDPFGPLLPGVFGPPANALGLYGTAAVQIKVGGAIQGMLFHVHSITELG